MRNILFFILFPLLFTQCETNNEEINKETIWPEITREQKPWTRWWWMGNAITKPEIERQLNNLAKAGFGGVEIASIYGVKGYEDKNIDFLSDEWIDILQFTIEKAGEIGLGVDMTLGTGWPFGGSQITPKLAASKLILQKYQLKAGNKLAEPIAILDTTQVKNDVETLAIIAYDTDGNTIDLTDFLNQNGYLNWVPEEDCKIIVAFNGKTRQKVKRSSPGGHGWTMDHFSKEALKKYLRKFDSAFAKINTRPRAFFNDSYEAYGSSSSKSIFEEFKNRRSYDLKTYLPKLEDEENSEKTKRIQADFRLTLGELLLEEFTRPWVEWSHGKNVLVRNQAHGSPANIIDLYAEVDIPECESFGSSYFPIPEMKRDSMDIWKVTIQDPIMMKFATSATNVVGKKLASAESFTWLAEHFRAPLSLCKPNVEQEFLAGVNHVFYHGTTYSPKEANWPGWLFYASVNFGPTNSFWTHISGLNEYISRTQSVLQGGGPDNDLLVYWPIYDVWNEAGKLDRQFSIHNIHEWLLPTAFYKESKKLMDSGYLIDFATDRFISKFSVENHRVFLSDSGGKYKTIVIPKCKMMPIETFKNILNLAEKGAIIVFQELPEDVPGFYDLDSRREEFKKIKGSISFQKKENNIEIAKVGEGKVLLSENLTNALKKTGINNEILPQKGLQFIRRNINGEIYYFVVNHSPKDIDEFIQFNAGSNNVILMDPNYGDYGKITNELENGKSKIRIQLSSGKSIIVRCTNKNVSDIRNWKYLESSDKKILLNNPWKITFTNGGPELPESKELENLVSWTNLKDEKATNFSGQAIYEYRLKLDGELAEDFILDLGRVAESAKVWINNEEVGVLWSVPFKIRIGKYLKKGNNTIKIEVANLMANRIRYMDQNKMEWRKFHEINFVNINYQPFDASNWEPMPSGLLGPVVLRPVD